ncbi:MAG: peptidoglycan DD-metalloendopeptidase family protein [Lachnospiraceae bacterium]|nr:peptidoglycan DD-metalloendopeptidase family protein [Lachnospiraceae bacterium]
MRGWQKAFFTALCIIIVIGVYGEGIRKLPVVRASDLTNDTIKEKEAEIKDAKEMKEQLKDGLTDIKRVKEELESSKDDLTQYVKQLDGELAAIQGKIADLQEQIRIKEEELKVTEQELEVTQQELEIAIEDQERQYKAMKDRIRFMYEMGDSLYMELIFSAGSFGEMLNKAEYIEMLSAYDRRMLDEYVKAGEIISLHKEQLELEKEQLEVEKEYLEEARAGVEQEEAALNALIKEKEQKILQVANDIVNKEAAIAEYEAGIREQNDTIAALEKIVAEEKKRLEEERRLKYDGGMFAWPAPDFTRISDDYGNRIHPILNVPQFHNGVDMAALGGSPILAAYKGQVVAAAYSSTMGNYIMIDHGDGLYTIYMHASALYVSQGASVTRGQKIAAVGTTGRSTGNHLHFSVRLNGNYVSPWNYLSK